MIVFDLHCRTSGDVFEAWFRSNSDYADQVENGLVQCPVCQSTDIAKAPMAPAVSRSSSDSGEVLARLARAQAEMLTGSEWVGNAFPEQARAMHLGEIEVRKVHGQATLGEAKALADEGVPIAPLPLPVVPPNQVN